MATPHMTGILSYLLSVDPALSTADLRSLIDQQDAQRLPSAGGAPWVDLFDAVMGIDTLRNNSRVLTMFVDVDDGTTDGNQRVDADGAAVLQEQPLGDGRVDMRDFRRFRDALLQAEGVGAFDGDPAGPKHDLNGDGLVLSPEQENVFPRVDFNGDGVVSRTATAFVGSVVQQEATDLAVLQLLFEDPHPPANALDALLDSADVHVDAARCFAAEPLLTSVRSGIWLPGGNVLYEAERAHTAAEMVQVYTVPANTDLELWVYLQYSDGSDTLPP